MQPLSSELLAAYGHQLDRAQVPTAERPDYHKWVRFYLDFCHKYGHGPGFKVSSMIMYSFPHTKYDNLID